MDNNAEPRTREVYLPADKIALNDTVRIFGMLMRVIAIEYANNIEHEIPDVRLQCCTHPVGFNSRKKMYNPFGKAIVTIPRGCIVSVVRYEE